MPTNPQDHNKPTSVKDWKNKSQVQLSPTPLDLPSGNTCLVQPIGITTFVQQGMIPNALMPIVKRAIEAAEKKQADSIDVEKLAAEMMNDMDKMSAIFELADAVTVACVVEPSISAVPEDPVLREEDLLYVDEVDIEDKMFILDFAVGGSRNLDKFRRQAASDVGHVQSGKRVGAVAKRPRGSRAR